MDVKAVYAQILILFIIMFVGAVIRKKNIISDKGVGELSALIFHITLPALIVYAISNTNSVGADVLFHMSLGTLISYVLLVLLSVIMPIIFFVKRGERGMYSFFTIFSNAAFIGYPMVEATLDSDSIFLGAIFNIPFNLLLYSLGIYYISSDKDASNRSTFKLSQVLNMGFFATILGVVLFAFGLRLPTVANDSLKMIGSLTTPLAMIIIGASLSNIQLSGLFRKYKLILFSVIKMTALPALIGVVLYMLSVNMDVVKVCVLLVAMPMGTNTVIVARKCESNVVLASEGVFISTILMLATSPLLVYGLNFLGSL